MTSSSEKKQTISGETQVFGITGDPVSHSLSPVMHNAAFQSLSYNGVYIPFPLHSPDEAVMQCLNKTEIKGLSVTIPHKRWACEHADEKDRLSEICGASNTLIFKDSRSFAYNTDGPGALKALNTKVKDLKDKNILLLGYGGSAAAIAHSFFTENTGIASIFIGGRNENKIQAFTELLQSSHKTDAVIAGSSSLPSQNSMDIIINTTPLGMKGQNEESPLPKGYILSSHTVFDIVYTPPDTPLVKEAKKNGAEVVYGYLMLLYQAALQFELFTGKPAPVSIMEEILLKESGIFDEG